MTRVAPLLIALLLALPARAQEAPADSSDVDEAVLENLSDDEISGDPTVLLELLENLRENPLDINRASAADLAQIPAFAASVAQEIVRFREAFGLFGSIPELRAVEGVTDEVFLEARPYLTIGRTLDENQARRLAEDGWAVTKTGSGWRRVVASPRPLAIVEAAQIRRLVQDDVIVIAAGGGGTPVYRDPVLRLEGVDAVIDKDRAAKVLAADIGAAVLLILTNVEGVYRAFDTPQQELLREVKVDAAERMLAAGEFGVGSMGPKVEAAIAFIRAGGQRAIVGRLDQGLSAVQGDSGTVILP